MHLVIASIAFKSLWPGYMAFQADGGHIWDTLVAFYRN